MRYLTKLRQQAEDDIHAAQLFLRQPLKLPSCTMDVDNHLLISVLALHSQAACAMKYDAAASREMCAKESSPVFALATHDHISVGIVRHLHAAPSSSSLPYPIYTFIGTEEQSNESVVMTVCLTSHTQ